MTVDAVQHEAVVPRDGSIQIFVRDPDGIQVELNVPPSAP